MLDRISLDVIWEDETDSIDNYTSICKLTMRTYHKQTKEFDDNESVDEILIVEEHDDDNYFDKIKDKVDS